MFLVGLHQHMAFVEHELFLYGTIRGGGRGAVSTPNSGASVACEDIEVSLQANSFAETVLPIPLMGRAVSSYNNSTTWRCPV